MMPLIFDSHAHYDQKRFNDDREVVIDSLKAAGVGAVLNSASNVRSSKAALELAKKYDVNISRAARAGIVQAIGTAIEIKENRK